MGSSRADFGRRLRDARRIANRSQEQLAIELGVTQATVSRWEAGLSLPSLELVAAYCRICGCDPAGLVTGIRDPQQLPLGIDPEAGRALQILERALRERPGGD